MNAFGEFVDCFGTPRPETALGLDALGLPHAAALHAFADDVGFGVFADGLISVGSVREAEAELDGWAAWVPDGARRFATSAFGILYLLSGEDIWVIDTQEGVVVESDLSMEELIAHWSSPEALRGSLRGELFAAWLDRAGALASNTVLCPTPALALGGTWAVESLAAMSMPVYLAFTAALFRPQGDAAVDLRRR